MIQSLLNINEKLIKNYFTRFEIQDAKDICYEYDELDLNSNFIAFIHYIDNVEIYLYFENGSIKTNLDMRNPKDRLRIINFMYIIIENWNQDSSRKTNFKSVYINLFDNVEKNILPKVIANKLKSLRDYYFNDYYNFESRYVALISVICELDVFDGRVLTLFNEINDKLGLYQNHSLYLKINSVNKMAYLILKNAVMKCENISSLKHIMTTGNDIEKALASYSGYRFTKNTAMIENLKQNIDNIFMKDALIQIYYELGMYKEIREICLDLEGLIDLKNVFKSLINIKDYELLDKFIAKYKYYVISYDEFKKIESNISYDTAKEILDNFENKEDIKMLAYYQKYKSNQTIEKMLNNITIDDFIKQIDVLSKYDTNLYFYSKKLKELLRTYSYSTQEIAQYVNRLSNFKYGFVAALIAYVDLLDDSYLYRNKKSIESMFKGLQLEFDNKIYSFFQIIKEQGYNIRILKPIISSNYDAITKEVEYDAYNERIYIRYSFDKYIYNSSLGQIKINANFDFYGAYGNYTENTRFSRFKDEVILVHKRFIEENKEELLSGLKEAIDNYNLKLIEEKKQNDKIRLDRLISELNNVNETTLQTKCHLYPYIYKHVDGYKLELKIGINKVYIVKSIIGLMDMIDNQETYKYGKDLVLTHSLENFDLESQNLIKLLLLLHSSDQARCILINPLALDEIINIYKDKEIKIKIGQFEENCFANLDVVDCKLNINSNDTITVDSDCQFLYGTNNTYVIKNNIINIVNLKTKKLKTIFDNISRQKTLDITYSKETFKKEIYTRVNQICNVEDEVKDYFKLEEVKIESFFDYEDGQLMHETKYYIDGVESDLNNITKLNHVSDNLTRYEDIVKSFGFYNQTVKDNETIATFLRSDLTSLKEVSDVYVSESLKQLKIKKLERVTFSVQSIKGIISIQALGLTYTNEELAQIIKQLRKKKRFVKLNKDTIVEVDEKTAFDLLNAIDDFDLDENKLNDEKEIPLYQLMKLDEETEYEIDIKDNIKGLLSEISGFKESDYEVSDKLKGIMREYQVEAFKWLKMLQKHNFSGILADDMGLGKSIEVLSLLDATIEEMPSLIICPKSLVFNWNYEVKKWLGDNLSTCIVGNLQERKAIINKISQKKHYYIISYDTFKNDQELFKNVEFNYCILDEAQFIKNHSTQKARSVRTVNSKHKLCLTGTPIENSVLDLWSIFDFLMPGYLHSYNKFKSEYEKNIQTSKTKSNRLLKKITPFILRRTKEDVLKDLPEKTETILSCEMNVEQRKLYEAQLLKAKEALKDNNKITILSTLTRLRQLCVDPGMYVEDYSGESSKLGLLKETIESKINENHRILVFSQFTSVFSKIEDYLNEANIKYFIITGDTLATKRIEYCNTFNKDDTYKVFLISLKAGGTGLNLTGADTVIHLDPWWNVSAQNQATDRAHRIGQVNTVNVLKLICENSIEEKVLLLQEAKKEIIDKLISNNDENITKLTDEDFNFLIN